jgi:uncharacterized protein
MKTFGDKYILDSGVVDPIDALHWGLSQKISVLIAGIDNAKILDQSLRAVRTFKPLSADDAQRILDKTCEAASEGKYELFKISTHFDGTAHNPDWLGEELLGLAS